MPLTARARVQKQAASCLLQDMNMYLHSYCRVRNRHTVHTEASVINPYSLILFKYSFKLSQSKNECASHENLKEQC